MTSVLIVVLAAVPSDPRRMHQHPTGDRAEELAGTVPHLRGGRLGHDHRHPRGGAHGGPAQPRTARRLAG